MDTRIWRVNPRDRGGRAGLPKRRADHDREGSLVCPD